MQNDWSYFLHFNFIYRTIIYIDSKESNKYEYL